MLHIALLLALFITFAMTNQNSLSIKPSNLIVSEGELVNFTCSCIGSCNGLINWWFYRKPTTVHPSLLNNNGHFQCSTNFTDGQAYLVQKSSIIYYSGVYKCSIRDTIPNGENNAELVVLKTRPACQVTDVLGMSTRDISTCDFTSMNLSSSKNVTKGVVCVAIRCDVEFNTDLRYRVTLKNAKDNNILETSTSQIQGAESSLTRLTSIMSAKYNVSECHLKSSNTAETCSYNIVYQISQNNPNRTADKWPTLEHVISREFILEGLRRVAENYNNNSTAPLMTTAEFLTDFFTSYDSDLTTSNISSSEDFTETNSTTTKRNSLQNIRKSIEKSQNWSFTDKPIFKPHNTLLVEKWQDVVNSQHNAKPSIDILHLILAGVAVLALTILIVFSLSKLKRKWRHWREKRHVYEHPSTPVCRDAMSSDYLEEPNSQWLEAERVQGRVGKTSEGAYTNIKNGTSENSVHSEGLYCEIESLKSSKSEKGKLAIN